MCPKHPGKPYKVQGTWAELLNPSVNRDRGTGSLRGLRGGSLHVVHWAGPGVPRVHILSGGVCVGVSGESGARLTHPMQGLAGTTGRGGWNPSRYLPASRRSWDISPRVLPSDWDPHHWLPWFPGLQTRAVIPPGSRASAYNRYFLLSVSVSTCLPLVLFPCDHWLLFILLY